MCDSEQTTPAEAFHTNRIIFRAKTILTAGMAILVLVAVAFARPACGQAILQSDGGSFQLFNGQDISAWNQVGNANWQIHQQELVVNQGAGTLVGRFPVVDFDLQIEYWLDQGAQVSLFIHSTNPNVINRDTAYQINLAHAPIEGYGAGSVVGALMAPAITTASQWNKIAIKSRQNKLSIVLNGIVAADNLIVNRFASGPVAIRFDGGNFAIRKITAVIPGRW